MRKKLCIKFIMISSLLALVLEFACGKKFVLPEYETAKEQWLYAMKMKNNMIIGVDKEVKERQLERIEAAFLKVIKEFPEDKQFTPAAYINLGDAYLKFKEPKKSIKTLKEAIKRYPDQADVQLFAHFGIGLAYDMLGRFAEAKKEYKFCIDKFGSEQNAEFKKIIERCHQRYNRIGETK